MKKTDKEKSSKNGIKGLLLIFAWLVFALVAVIFFFYFKEKLPFFNKEEEPTYTYKINEDPTINQLMEDYHVALNECDIETLVCMVVDPSQFDGMDKFYEKKAELIQYKPEYTVYTYPGYYSSDTLVYVVCNISMMGVECKNINQFYIINTTGGYKIDNTQLDENVQNYIDEYRNTKDIQDLYEDVYVSVEQCAEENEEFKKFSEESGLLTE